MCRVNKINASLEAFPVHTRELNKKENRMEQSFLCDYVNCNLGYIQLFMV